MCDFTYTHYQEILDMFRKYDYVSATFQTFKPKKPYQVIFRHDVDVLLPNLLTFAHIETDNNFQAVYHFLLTSELYNPKCQSIQTLIHELRKLGHVIGVHIDPTQLTPDQLNTHLILAIQILGPIDSYSLHHPNSEQMNGWNYCAAVPAAYPANELQQILYKADSTRRWKSGCICHDLPLINGRSMILLTHPNSWSKDALSTNDNIERFYNTYTQLHDLYFAQDMGFIPKEWASKKQLSTYFLSEYGDINEN